LLSGIDRTGSEDTGAVGADSRVDVECDERDEGTVKKFILLTYGFEQPTPEIMEAWGSWFASIGDNIVDHGGPAGGGRKITSEGTTDLAFDLKAFTGYVMIKAADLDEATAIAEACPIITSIQVCETRSMYAIRPGRP
jgi:hypothetical protein